MGFSKEAESQPLIIILVHGTWARNAQWAQPGSSLWQALDRELGHPAILPFQWSGKNTFQAREDAAQALRQYLILLARGNPNANLFIIGHSHGGSVALYAVKEDAIRKRIQGVACLSTPFLVTKRRNNIFWQVESELQKSFLQDALYAVIFSMLFLGIVATYALTACPWQQFDIGKHPKETTTVLFVIYATALAAHLISAKTRGTVTEWSAERIARFIHSTATIEKALDLTGLSSAAIFIARSVADEGSSFIGSAQLVAWLATRIWLEVERLGSRMAGGLIKAMFPDFVYKHFPRTLFGMVRLFLLTSGLVLGIFICRIALIGSGEHTGRLIAPFLGIIGINFFTSVLMWSTLAGTRVMLYFLAPIVWALLTLLSILPFGWELAVRNIFLSISAESTPRGSWQIELIEPTITMSGKEVPLSHSEIYDSDTGQTKIVAWIRERCSDPHDT